MPVGTVVGDGGVEVGVLGVGVVGVEVGVFVAVTGAAFTVTWKPPEAVLPAVSVEEQFTVVVPTGKFEPEAGEQAIVTSGSMASDTEAE